MKEKAVSAKPEQNVETVFENKYVTVRLVPSIWGPHVSVQSGNGKGAVVIIANKTEGETKILFVNQPRFALTKDNKEHNGFYTWELPRGGANPNENIFDTAKREVEEETNIILTDEKIIHLGTSYTDTGIFNSEIDYFYVEFENINLDTVHYNDNEIIEHVWIPYEEVKSSIKDSIIKDNYTIVAFTKALLSGLIP